MSAAGLSTKSVAISGVVGAVSLAGWCFEFGRRHGVIAEAAAASASGGDAIQQVLRLGIERPVSHRQVRGVIGQTFGVVEFFPQQQ